MSTRVPASCGHDRSDFCNSISDAPVAAAQATQCSDAPAIGTPPLQCRSKTKPVWRGINAFLALGVVGLAEFALFTWLSTIPDLPKATVQFVTIWLMLALLNAGAIAIVANGQIGTRRGLVIIGIGAVLFRVILLPLTPTSSDDAYRFIWDGRVQAAGINPYRYPPAAPELAALRDETIWPLINRPAYPTIYPPAAQIAFAAIYRIAPDNLTATKAVFALFDLIAGGLIALTLSAAGRTPLLAVAYLWHPVPIIEFAQAGHLDPLMLVPIAAAAWFRVRNHQVGLGIALGVAVLVKFYPALLLVVWWRWREWRVLIAAAATVVVLYLPYLGVGPAIVGFLPFYFGEEGYNTGDRYFFFGQTIARLPLPVPSALWTLLVVAVVAAFGLVSLRRPPVDSVGWLRRAAWLAFTILLLVTPSFPWYYGWMLLLACAGPYRGTFYLGATMVFAYLWWWLPDSGLPPGPWAWIYLPALALGFLELRARITRSDLRLPARAGARALSQRNG